MGSNPKTFLLIYSFMTFVVLIHLVESLILDDFKLNLVILLIIMTVLSLIFWIIIQKMQSIKKEIIIMLTFIIFIILIDLLLLDFLRNTAKLDIILYLISIYYVLFDKMNKYCSFISLNFLIIYTSFKSLQLYNEPFSRIFCNFALISFQIMNLIIMKRKNTFKKTIKLKKEQSFFHHLYDDAFPGMVFLFKKKVLNENNFAIELSFINKKARDEYGVKDYKGWLDLLDIIFDYNEILNNIKINETFGSNTISLKKEILNNIKKMMNDKLEENLSLKDSLMGFCPKNKKKMRIFITSFLQNNIKEIVVFIDDNQFEEDYCALKEMDEKKDKMLIAITHDLRSPLNGILAFINLAKNESNLEVRNRKLDLAEINGNLLMSLIEDILDFQSIAQNKFNLTTEDSSLNEILEEIVALISIQTQDKNINFTLNTNFGEAPIDLFTDVRRLKQILLNILTNSIKFTMSGGYLKMNVFCTQTPNIIKFEIIDSGIGIKQELIEKLCEPFNTFDTNGLNKYGIGFGLYLCKKLSSLLGPKDETYFHISSIYGKGSKIGFLIYQKLGNSENKTSSLMKAFFHSGDSPLASKNVAAFGKIKQVNSSILTPNFRNEIFKTKLLSKEGTQTKKDENFSESVNAVNEERLKKITWFKNRTLSIRKTYQEGERESLKNSNNENRKIEKQKTPNYKEITYLTPTHSHSKMGFSKYHMKIDENGKSKNLNKAIIFSESILFSTFTGAEFKSGFAGELSDYELEVFECSERHMMTPKSLQNYVFKYNTKRNSCIAPEIKLNLVSDSLDKINVLIVDDNAFNLMVLREFLKKISGFNIHIEQASNGVECLKLFQNNKKKNSNNFNIIFMDCVMPIMDGYETSIEIKRLVEEENFVDLFIIAVTGMSGMEEENKCIKCRMDDFITKPVSEKELIEMFLFYMQKIENY